MGKTFPKVNMEFGIARKQESKKERKKGASELAGWLAVTFQEVCDQAMKKQGRAEAERKTPHHTTPQWLCVSVLAWRREVTNLQPQGYQPASPCPPGPPVSLSPTGHSPF